VAEHRGFADHATEAIYALCSSSVTAIIPLAKDDPRATQTSELKGRQDDSEKNDIIAYICQLAAEYLSCY